VRLAFVVPRYGEEVLGGAETAARELAERLAHTGISVDVMTTCAAGLRSWQNVYAVGCSYANGVNVHRFPVDHRIRNMQRYWELLAKFANGWPASVDEEYEFIHQSAHSPALYAHLARVGRDYEFLILIPYLFGITYYASTLWPRRTILWPCLHDEPFARFQATRLMLNSCRGIMFNCKPEMMLAETRLGVRNPGSCVVGLGLTAHAASAQRFRSRFGLSGPFVLYAGRLEGMKNVLQLLDFFEGYKRLNPGPLKLVFVGDGELTIPAHPDVVRLGFLDVQDKRDAFAAATVLCQPSLMESFSIVVMEAWLAGVPVLVHGDCDVTRYHVLQSNGGLYYSSFDEFTATLDWILEHPAERRLMGELGRAYVLREYNWEAVIARFRQALRLWQSL